MNQTGIFPLEYRVLVLPDKIDDMITTPNGLKLYKATTSEDDLRDQVRQEYATIIDAGSKAFEDWNVTPKIGAKILMARYAGDIVDGKDKQKYRLIVDTDIKAIIES